MSNVLKNNTEPHQYITRSQKRWNLVYYLRVFNADNGELLGHIVDLTTDGLMIISESCVAINQHCRLKMEVPIDNEIIKSIELEAKSLWSKKDINPHFYDTGFKLIEPSREAIKAITLLIEELAFDSN
jgi:hypothetical protein